MSRIAMANKQTVACHSICYEKHCAVKAEIIAFPHKIMTLTLSKIKKQHKYK